MSDRKKSWLMVAFWVGLLALLALIRPLSLPDEGRYADIGRWMYVSGDWLVPRFNGAPFFHKPPLLYWMHASAFHVLGVHVWSARWVTVLHAAVLLMTLYLAVRAVEGEAKARKVVAIFGSSLGFLIGGQYINHDFLVATWISVAILAFAVAILRVEGEPQLAWARMGFLACGLGFMSKGLIGIVLPGLVLFVWLLMTGQMRKIASLPWVSGLLLLGAVVVPWPWMVQQAYPDFLDYFIVKQHFSRFVGAEFNNKQAVWFYPAIVGIFMGPWLLVWMAGLARRRLAWPNFAVLARDPWASLPWIWFLAILVFFSVPRSKPVGYILPVLPAMALLVAHSWDRWTNHQPLLQRWFVWVCGLSVAWSVGANFLARSNSLEDSSRAVARVLACKIQATDKVYVTGAYPYDFMFEANLQQPLLALDDWDNLRKKRSDDWRQVLMDGVASEPASEGLLQSPQVLALVKPGDAVWLVKSRDVSSASLTPYWQLDFESGQWQLWKPAGTANTGAPGAKSTAACVGQSHWLD